MTQPSYRLNNGTLELYSKVTVQDIEECLGLLEGQKFSRLKCAHNMGFLPPFATGRLVQFVQTWAQARNDAVCVVHCTESDTKAQLPTFAANPHGIACLSLADRVESKDDQDITIEAKTILADHLESVEGEYSASDPQPELDLGTGDNIPVRGRALFLTAEDAPKIRLSKWLYRQSGVSYKPRGASDFDTMVGRLVRAAGKTFNKIETRIDLGSIFSEVFENTDNWGMTNINGEVLNKSLRCAHLRVIVEYDGNETVSDMLRGNDFIGEFVSRVFPKVKEKAKLLELSIVDGGVGYAPRLAKKPLSQFESIEDEFLFLRGCLCHQGTSGSALRGFGLVKACKAANALNALLVIRSGHLFLYRDFSKEEHKIRDLTNLPDEYFTEEDARLYDVISGATSDINRNPPVSGVTYSILIPF